MPICTRFPSASSHFTQWWLVRRAYTYTHATGKDGYLSLWYSRERNPSVLPQRQQIIRRVAETGISGCSRSTISNCWKRQVLRSVAPMWWYHVTCRVWHRNLSPFLTPGRKDTRRCARGAGGRSSYADCFVVCRLPLRSAPRPAWLALNLCAWNHLDSTPR